MRRWTESRLDQRRRLAAAIGPLALLAAYGWPGPARDATGYPGPLGPAPDLPRRLAPLCPEGDEELARDVVVVGSGAGGGGGRRRAGPGRLDVVVLEKGGYRAERDFTHQEGDAYRDLYLYATTLTTDDLGCRILAGSTLGGGTVVNYSTSFVTPPAVLAEWAATSGVQAFVNGEVEAAVEAVAERVGVTDAQSRPGARDRLLWGSAGWHVAPLPRNVRGCSQDAGCGWCGFGCRTGAKQSTLVTYLEEAAAAGTRLVVGADARRVLVDGGRAAGVEARTGGGGHRLVVRARAVVAAAGAIETPALLLRSGLGGQVGQHLRLHRAPPPWGCSTSRSAAGGPPGPLLGPAPAGRPAPTPPSSTVPVHPGTAAVALPWRSAADHLDLMVGQPVAGRGAVPRHRRGRPGPPRPPRRQPLGPLAAQPRRRGPHASPGAGRRPGPGRRSQRGVHPPAPAGPPTAPATRRATGTGCGRSGGPGSAPPGHPGLLPPDGLCRMGTDSATRPSAPTTRPTSCPACTSPTPRCSRPRRAVNPMLSVMALAHRAAGLLAARLG